MASDGLPDQQHHSGELEDSNLVAAGAGIVEEAHDPDPWQSAHQFEEDLCEAESDQPSSLSENLSQRVQDEVGAENERGADADDPNNYPLHSSWSFWFDRSSRSATAQDFFAHLKKVCSIKTIKAFWCLYNNVVPVEQLQERESYHLMRGEERRPVWEDLNNIDGGFWAFKVPKEDTQLVWQELLLAAIGEQFSGCVAEDDEVCGISVKIRGYGSNTIQIWHVDSEKHYDARVIQKVKSLLPSIEINEYYQSSKLKMKEHVSKPPHAYHGAPPPQFTSRYPHPSPHHGIFPPPPHAHYGPRYAAQPPGAYPHHHPHHYRAPPPGSGPPGPRGYHSHSRPSYHPPT